jgi:hypothetical protein
MPVYSHTISSPLIDPPGAGRLSTVYWVQPSQCRSPAFMSSRLSWAGCVAQVLGRWLRYFFVIWSSVTPSWREAFVIVWGVVKCAHERGCCPSSRFRWWWGGCVGHIPGTPSTLISMAPWGWGWRVSAAVIHGVVGHCSIVGHTIGMPHVVYLDLGPGIMVVQKMPSCIANFEDSVVGWRRAWISVVINIKSLHVPSNCFVLLFLLTSPVYLLLIS